MNDDQEISNLFQKLYDKEEGDKIFGPTVATQQKVPKIL